VFALLWTMLMMAVIVWAFGRVGGMRGLTPESYRPAGRLMLALVAVGIGMIWPMVRLSQRLPTRPGAGEALRDLVVVLLPVQAVVWPQVWLAGWPIGVVACVAAMIAGWACVIAGVLAWVLEGWVIADGRSDRGGDGLGGGVRALVMSACVMLILGGAAAASLAPGAATPPDALDSRWTPMLSPITSIYELTRDRPWTGQSAAVGPVHWRGVWVVAAVGVMLWTGAALTGAMRRRARARG